MLNNAMIVDILKGLKGQTLHLRAIQRYVQSNATLSALDLAPYTNTLPTNYPTWKHRLSAALQFMNNAGLCQEYAGSFYSF